MTARDAAAPAASDGRSRPLRIRVLSGPNLDLLGTREPHIYGTRTLADIHRALDAAAKERDVELECLQSNHEGDLATWIGHARLDGFDGVVVNAAALTHTSLVLYDAARACGVPVVEVHLSNPEAREAYRRRSRIAPACLGKVSGFGAASYLLGLLALVDHLRGGGPLSG